MGSDNKLVFPTKGYCQWIIEFGPRKGTVCNVRTPHCMIVDEFYLFCKKHDDIMQRRNWEDK